MERTEGKNEPGPPFRTSQQGSHGAFGLIHPVVARVGGPADTYRPPGVAQSVLVLAGLYGELTTIALMRALYRLDRPQPHPRSHSGRAPISPTRQRGNFNQSDSDE